LRPLTRLADLADRCARDRKAVQVPWDAPDLAGEGGEARRLAISIRRMAAVLYNRIESNEHFAADVAHEIRTPLVSLHGAVGSLRIVGDEAQRARLLAIVEDDVRRLDRLVRDIAQASQLGGALATETMREFDLVRMMTPLLDRVRAEAEGKGALLVTDMPDGQVRLRGLEERIAQVATNLLANALSFSGPGDGIRVWVRRQPDGVIMAVEDSGPGIPEAALERIFTRFVSHRPNADGGRNAGLGLAIARQIAEVHGGTIRAENVRPSDHDPGSRPCGARFVLTLPV
jgi:two-component system sensor histidine kinase ChvG